MSNQRRFLNTFAEHRNLTVERVARKMEELEAEPSENKDSGWREQFNDIDILYTQAKNATTHGQLTDILLDTALEQNGC